MQVIKQLLKALTLATFVTGFLLDFSACSNSASPVSPNSDQIAGLQILKLADVTPSLAKRISASQFISRQEGGTLELEYEAQGEKHALIINISLRVKKNTISMDATLSLGIDDTGYLVGSFDVNFGPHGIVFSQPAILNITVRNADLTGIDASALDVYYVNQGTGSWEQMAYKSLKIDRKKGKLVLRGAKIPHFSRYAIAHSR